jgi:septal ring factor EnvC (AmiA/AmiB activator)
MRFDKTIIIISITTVMWCGVVSAEYYRWKDNNGGTQYGDQVPAEDVDNGRIRVNEGGQVVEQISAAKSPEEQKRYEEQQRIAKLERERKEEQEAYDRVLLNTFNSDEEIMQVRDERISLIEQSIKLSRERLRKQQKELAKLTDSRNRFIDRDMEPPVWIHNNELKVLSRIAGIEEYISDKGLEKERLRKRFGEDLQRYKELTKRSVTSR